MSGVTAVQPCRGDKGLSRRVVKASFVVWATGHVKHVKDCDGRLPQPVGGRTKVADAFMRDRFRTLTRMRAILFCLALTVGGIAAYALECSICHREIEGAYIKKGDRVFCSDACYRKTLPRCDECGEALAGKAFSFEGKTYCPQCIKRHLPRCETCGKVLYHAVLIDGHPYCRKHADAPTCSKCGLPAPRGIELADGRRICRTCNHNLIYTREEAEPHYRRALAELHEVTGYRTSSLPNLLLVGTDRLREESTAAVRTGMRQRGLYRRNTTTTSTSDGRGNVHHKLTKVEELVFMPYGLTAQEFLATAVHELMHDQLAERFPGVPKHAPIWVEEGICQYVAAAVCSRKGYGKPLATIRTNPDPAYGDGYRYFRRRLGGDNRW